MSLLLIVPFLLVACHPGKVSSAVLHPSPEEPMDAQSPPIIRTNRCLGDPLQSIRKTILDSLNLQTEPHMSVPGMAEIRERWINVFKDNTQPSSSSSLSSSSSSGNSTQLQCCKFASQVFIKDLGWDQWIIYPDSFTFVQCSVCVSQQNQRMFNCRNDDPPALDPPSQKPCCKVTSLDLVPFLYMDETSTLILSSVPLTRTCGCRHGDDTQALQL
ncbi:bone morphogenetic protein 6-like [Neoarius graeffei]|uniref:bone morphogenetic protein 6-like n=1 Tax=Neoarius graeffei TaxID=443677 RepID=UPI00298C51E2|nr:bone morphogenetic protein 6-like [Neoarius graeffei]XP_060769566.1 bone morphogenetic protein 6-like [Neoarius graeffei]XP_060769567.1 bone morphogenetic protein 6-like [Neoarius graeffei]XP_060769568.1 bone morphogenetic protein 6-like [Neoarius graeffei]